MNIKMPPNEGFPWVNPVQPEPPVVINQLVELDKPIVELTQESDTFERTPR